MPKKSQPFDFKKPVAFDGEAKRAFHTQARRQLQMLGAALGLSRSAFELRHVRAGLAVSGEIALHGDHIYVQVSQPDMGYGSGILFRTCVGRDDRDGGTNNFLSLDLLNQPAELARIIKEKCCV